jgi:hypothetical protein
VAEISKSASNCLNCETSLNADDVFCPTCGQENRDLKISFWELITEFLSSNFNFDTKLGRTLVDLLLKPGEITKQFNNGKRIRYVKPVQMYFFVSFVYFLLLGLNPQSFVNKELPGDEQIATLNESNMVDVNLDGTDLQEISNMFSTANPENKQEIDSLIHKLGITEITPWQRHLARQGIRSLNPKNEDALTQEVYANLSIAMFFLLPLFAMLLWLFTRKNSPFYMDALVFSIHFHCVVLLIFSASMIAGMAFLESTVFKISLALILLYLWLALKRVFKLRWMQSLGKTLGLSVTYSVLFGLTYLLILVLSFWIY